MAATPRPGIGSHRWMGLKSIRLPLREIVNKLGATRSRESTRYLRATDLLPLPPPCMYMCACFVAPHTRAVYRDSLVRMRELSEITQRGRRTSYELNKDTRIRGWGLRRAGKRKGRGSGGGHRRGTNTPTLRLLTHVARWGLLAQHRLCGNQPGRVKCFSPSFFDLRPFPPAPSISPPTAVSHLSARTFSHLRVSVPPLCSPCTL